MRFDDSLKTVLAADTTTAFGAQSAFRQLVDLLGRRRISSDPDHIDRLRVLRAHVPASVRAACARALALAVPEAPLVAFFAEDEPSIAAPVLRGVTLTPEAWCGLLSGLGPTGRAVLRSRRDLPAEVMRGLDSFGSVDFSLPGPKVAASAPAAVNQPTAPAHGAGPFVALGEVARKLPVVEEALRHAEGAQTEDAPATAPHFEISDLVARIAAYQKDRTVPEASASDAPADRFDFETDAGGIVCWVGAGVRGALIGLSLTGLQGEDGHVVDGVVAGAFRRRSGFRDARMTVGGGSAMAGPWRISAVPCFDEHSGRFTGFRGLARRPRADESAAPRRSVNIGASESLRRLVHELRTPTNAIAGFSELIETELMGPIDPRYRDRARAIRLQAGDLIAAIEDLDIAARIAGDTLELRPGQVDAGALIRGLIRDLEPLASLRGSRVTLDAIDAAVAVAGDDRAVERLIGRLLSAIVSAGGPGEAIGITLRRENDAIAIDVDRPAALAAIGDDALLRIDAESEAAMPGAPLLGTGFALRLARNLALELGGELQLEARRLTLRLPAVPYAPMEQASIH
ncbi:conserved hypothetical protein [Sphingomonas sp. EC-HK361]|uniref:sensor histidine kinase n=1 Tax=Sphingomonas sp. EC-HK361 TaxID=2038397 RepID=UPI0012522F24|nr:HAMP domain-containing sensor histidine kinase [Sphingomonas sp. EC-HK361]VVT07281.1 conserved hypothetical protein [Sphingomonas sp. EC-HK361]